MTKIKLTKKSILAELFYRNEKKGFGFSKNLISKKVKEYKETYYNSYKKFASWIFEDQEYEDRIDQVLDFCR